MAERFGVGRRRSSITRALHVGAIDRGTVSPRRGLRNADLVVVATPIGRFEAVFRQLADHLPDGAVVTDVGSTKQTVMDLAERLLPSRVRFVGSHPMAGSENTGVEFARADLFQRAPCVVVSPRRNDPEAVALVETFWQRLGMRTTRMNAREHDVLVAQISHLPHLVACALIEVAVAGDALGLAATGFQDTTRVASGNPQMWLDIVMTNRKAIGQAVDDLIDRLEALRRCLQAGQSEPVEGFLQRAKQARDAWIERRYAEHEIEP
jgi:prephenate dehydrogenase